ncbi:MAG: CoA pyrophosphatase [Lachnospiraceae bacterium]|nr:CoA pyrophosphatase [Lachnospiraceae bacterium]
MTYNLNKITTHTPRLIGENQMFRAAVTICLIHTEHGYDVLLQTRSGKIAEQPGDVCLPGGSIEKGETPKEAALREACEELLIQPEQLSFIGASDYHHFQRMIIYPYVAILKDYQGDYNKDEVHEVFRVPLSFFIENEPARFIIDSQAHPREDFPFELVSGGSDYKWPTQYIEELFYKYEGHVIWGLTARILHAFCEIIQEESTLLP